jgi:quinoprotein glucose dehydrogenase
MAIDLAAGKIVWREPVGRMDEPFPNVPKTLATGSIILGGPIVTGGGLIFIGGTSDRRFHALAAATGKELWSAALPASAHAQPITYEVSGRQFVVVAAGGAANIDEERQSDTLVAFALPSGAAAH